MIFSSISRNAESALRALGEGASEERSLKGVLLLSIDNSFGGDDDQFLAWQPFEGGRSFISAEFIAFILWVGGLVVRWTQLFVVSSSNSENQSVCE